MQLKKNTSKFNKQVNPLIENVNRIKKKSGPLIQLFNNISNVCQVIGFKVKEDAIAAYAGESTLFIIISFFPFLMFLLTLLKFLPFSESDFIMLINYNIPEVFASPLLTIVDEVFNKSGGTVMGLTIFTTIWSSSRGTLAIIRGLNSVYDITEKRNYFLLRAIAILYTLIFTIVLILVLAVIVFGNAIVSALSSRIPDTIQSLLGIISMRHIFAIIILFVFFTFLFTFVPNRKSKLIYEVPGAIFTSLAWMIFSYAYAFYIENLTNFTYMYGSLTAIVLLLLWLYSCFSIMFVGGEINIIIQKFVHGDYVFPKLKDLTQKKVEILREAYQKAIEAEEKADKK